MSQLAKVHSGGGHVSVPPEFYPYWVESLLEVVAEADPQYTPALGVRWRLAMNPATTYFIENY